MPLFLINFDMNIYIIYTAALYIQGSRVRLLQVLNTISLMFCRRPAENSPAVGAGRKIKKIITFLRMQSRLNSFQSWITDRPGRQTEAQIGIIRRILLQKISHPNLGNIAKKINFFDPVRTYSISHRSIDL